METAFYLPPIQGGEIGQIYVLFEKNILTWANGQSQVHRQSQGETAHYTQYGHYKKPYQFHMKCFLTEVFGLIEKTYPSL